VGTCIAAAVLTLGFALPRIGTLLRAAPPSDATVGSVPALRGDALPPTLSATALFADLAALRPAADVVAYELNVPFWSDGAAKMRWVRLPPGTQIHTRADGTWSLPPGTTFVKHFEIATGAAKPQARKRLETRVLVVSADGTVDGATYRWRADASDAEIVHARAEDRLEVRSSDATTVTQVWHYMPGADCRTCHTPQAGGVLGINPEQLNRDVSTDGASRNQLSLWRELGLLAGDPDPAIRAPLPALDDAAIPIEQRARAWLAVNCAQCHTPGGAPTEFDLRYATPLARTGLINGRARINLGIDNARAIAPKDPWRSMILRRMETLDGNRMPPLAHERVDERGRDLLRAWIASLPGAPVLAPPVLATGAGAARVPLTVTIAHPDPAITIRYTIDGSAPISSSPAYEGPIRLEKPATLRARAFRDGHTRSIVAQRTFGR
jgi:uncharacterized repeat protein (TIGR03806 family)